MRDWIAQELGTAALDADTALKLADVVEGIANIMSGTYKSQLTDQELNDLIVYMLTLK